MTPDPENAGGTHRRPTGVPECALFVGGEDGGVYLICTRHERDAHRYCCTVYNDFSGRIEERGVFLLTPITGGDFDPSDPDVYSAWTLGCIYLRDGSTLEALSDEGITEG